MENLLPLLVVVPLGAAFLVPLLSLLSGKVRLPWSGLVALCGTAVLVVLSVATFQQGGTVTAWMGGYVGRDDLLGVTGHSVGPAEAQTEHGGVLVEQVVPGSQAFGEGRGVRVGDVITHVAVGGKVQPVRTLNELRRANSSLRLGTPFVLDVTRQGEHVSVPLVGGKSIVGIALVCDGLTRVMLLVISVVSFTAMLFSLSYMQGHAKLHLYYSPLMLMVAGMNGIVLTGDLFNMYVFLEVAAVASYALVGFGVQSEELEASFKYLVLSAVASGFILLGIGVVYAHRGTLNLAQIARFARWTQPDTAVVLALGFLLAGYGLKAAMVPFHAWLPDAHPSAPAPVSAMLSGVLIKASGVYVIARLVFNVFGPSVPVAVVLMGMGALSMVVGVFLAVGQWDFKRLLAYHSISQMGYVMLAFGVGAEVLARRADLTPDWRTLATLAVGAGVFHLVNHAAFKSLLFLASGSVGRSAGTRDLKKLGGMKTKMPWTSWFVRIGSLSISGVPPFNGFFSKLLIVIAVCWAGHWLLGALTVFVSFMTLLSFTKVQRYLIEGDVPEALAGVRESPAPMLAAMGVLAVLCVALGVLLPLHGRLLLEPAADALTGSVSGYAASVLGG